MTTFDDVVAAMRDARTYSGAAPADVEVRETAISMVFLVGARAYKVKKRVRLPYLDYTDPEVRRALCEEEVRLNRRLAPDAYLGVRGLVPADGGLRLADPDDRDAVEWAVEMRRLPADRTMAALLDAGRLSLDDARRVGARIAAFHDTAEAPERPPGPGAVKRPSDENFQTLLDLELSPAERRRAVAGARFADAFLAARRDELHARAAGGRVRDGHGDLRLEHVLLVDREVLAYDCVEFDPDLRRIDVAADVAFLVMELEARGGGDLADALLAGYRVAGGDPGGDALVHFYAAYRAWVRAKVAYLAGQRPAPLLAAAERLRWRARTPLVIAICGVTASGKSTIARRVADASGLPVLSSDRVRKELAGVPATARAPATAYGRRAGERTYAELGARARACVRDRGGVVVDATFRRSGERRRFVEALGEPVPPLLYVECRAPRRVLL
ncbi:MAG TPA: AAA family ATPase, partial [Solirubrobacteraceae bacterium]|nr:AAA family ATPase [Solirubrobacteraceae bacterium]